MLGKVAIIASCGLSYGCHSERSEESRIHFWPRPRRNRQKCFAPLNMRAPVYELFPAVFGQKLAELALPARLFLSGYGIFLKARCVMVCEIRSILVWLIEHFSPAARISPVLLDQLCDEPDIFVG